MIIANFHEIYNFFSKKLLNNELNNEDLKTNFIKILKIMQPVLPHLTNECLTKFDEKNI